MKILTGTVSVLKNSQGQSAGDRYTHLVALRPGLLFAAKRIIYYKRIPLLTVGVHAWHS